MQEAKLFNLFGEGVLALPCQKKEFTAVKWQEHPKFAGVFLKKLVAGQEAQGLVSFHLVRIEPYKQIGEHLHIDQLETHEIISGSGYCVNAGEKIAYRPGVISIFAANTKHQVVAGPAGLYLFAKFFPALD